MLISLYIPKPTDLSTFPTLILVITLFRLSLNIATTRMILSKGQEGPENVSELITAFGQFVVGGNYIIGVIVFVILVIINFMVVTNGSTRVAEVTARFTLDAMPGKQMAIDADLNAGLIDEAQAKARRQELVSEANFYGAMDGSSKFVKGDATAGIIITLVNIIAGFLIGVFQHGLSMAQSAHIYTILTIGDGLVGQIPALLMSTATGIIITRASKDEDNFAEGVVKQLADDYKILIIVGFILFIFALIPGFPTLSLFFVGFIFGFSGYMMKVAKEGHNPIMEFIQKKLPKKSKSKDNKKDSTSKDKQKKENQQNVQSSQPKETPEEKQAREEAAIEDIMKVELLELDIGYQLIKLADPNQHGDLLDRIKTMRKKIAGDFGFLMPQVRIRDNLQLPPNNYQIMLKGVSIGEGEIYPDKFMAMTNPMVTEEIEGIAAKEPAFGIDAIWIDAEIKDDATMMGYTIVDPSTVIVTHMSEMVKKYSEELLTRQDVQNILDRVRKDYPAIVDDALKVATNGLIQRVLKELLHEKIPIKDMITILETIADIAEITKNIDIIVEHVRSKLARVITSMYKDENGVLKLLTFETNTEQFLLNKLQQNGDNRQFLLTVAEMNRVVEETSSASQNILSQGIAPVIIVVDPLIRKSLSEIFERFNLDVVLLSHAEIDSSAKFEVLGAIEIQF